MNMKRLCFAVVLASIVPGVALAQVDGATLFAQHCAVCHQATGIGTVGLAPSLIGPHWAKLGADKTYLPTVLTKGMSGAIMVNDQRFVGSMPSFAGQLDNASMVAIGNHLGQLQGSTGAAKLTEADYQAARDLPGGPPQTRIKRGQILGN